MDGEQIGIMGIGAGIFGLLIAFMLYRKVDSIEIENKTVATITARIQDGAMAFLMAEYRMLSIFIVVVAALLFAGGEDNGLGMETMVAFIIGALCSVAAGFSGMQSLRVRMDELHRLLQMEGRQPHSPHRTTAGQ